MLFRRPEWDVPMPDSLVCYWTAWNEANLDLVPGLLARAVTSDVEWNDPRDSFVGISHLEDAVRKLRTRKPGYHFSIASEIDHHHDRFRYRWDMTSRGRILMEGLDIVTVDSKTSLICRVDGFFGEPTPIDPATSRIPSALLAWAADDSQR